MIKLVSGSGTSVDPFILTTLDDLELIGTAGYSLGAYYKLGSDIDASGTQDPEYNEGAGWLPIPGLFKGNFNGDGYAISGLYINRPTTNNVGFMEHLRDNGIVRNLTISGTIIGQDTVGGITGYAWDGNISNCNINMNITGRNQVGGFCGDSYPALNITSCSFNGNIIANSYVGGIIGNFRSWSGHGSLSLCSAQGSITATSSYVGGMIGKANDKGFSNMSITNMTFNCGAEVDNIGGFIGYLYGGSLTNIHTEVTIQARNGIGGIAGYVNPGAAFLNCSFEGELSGTGNIGGLIGNGNGTIITSTVKGELTASSGDIGGLAGHFENGIIQDCSVNGSVLTINSSGANNVGGFVGSGYELGFTRCHSRINLIGLARVGGLCGNLYPARDIIQCSYVGNLTGTSNVGGLTGHYDCWDGWNTISESYALGIITATSDNVGGLTGHLKGGITNSYSRMTVNGNNIVGGLVGNAYSGVITNSYAAGIVSGSTNVGGLLGRNQYGSSATNSYWDTETSGQATSALGTPLTSDQMKCLGG